MTIAKKLLRAGLWLGGIGIAGVPVAHIFAAAPLALPGVVTGLSGPSNINGVVCGALSWIFYGAVILSIILILSAAFKYMTASGEPEKIKSAHKQLMFVAIGLAVAILSRTIPIVVGSFLGVSGLDPCASVSGGQQAGA